MATKMKTIKTYHRWTPEESQKLLEAVSEFKPMLEQAGQPGATPASVIWSQIPGKIGVLVTPEAAAMQYRVLTSDARWARERRKAFDEVEATTGDLVAQAEAVELATVAEKLDHNTALLGEMRDILRALLLVWKGEEGSSTSTAVLKKGNHGQHRASERAPGRSDKVA